MSEKLKRFIDLLKEMFEMDKEDLDFGIYRIMKLRKNEVENFIDNDLPIKVKEILSSYAKDNLEIRKKMNKIEESCIELGLSIEELPETSEKKKEYIELKKSLESGKSLAEIEADVYSKLYDFFSRYYDEGDFISKRRYKEGVYAIPYEGEEVKLYWANHDQYYIKTSEYFKNYSFVSQGITVNFRLVEVSTEQDNNKEAKDEKRRFVLLDENFLEVGNDEINIYFEYKVNTAKQDTLVKSAYEKIKNEISKLDSKYLNALLIPAPTEKHKNRTLLEKHLTTYVAKNTFDYFIHKDLKKFLKRELDFYIKSEVMKLDDIGTEKEDRVESYLCKIRAIKNVGEIIIDFLAQIEDFQKKLWLKKKFVVETDWCITLDLIDEKFYPEIVANQKQIDEWIEYYKIDAIKNDNKQIAMEDDQVVPFSIPLTVDFLKQNRNLVLDTKHFDREFKERLIESIDNLDEKTNGLLIHSENFQALKLLEEKYKGKVQCVYIDPPYNSPSSEIVYKNNFKHSTWLSLMENRLTLSKKFNTEDGSTIVAIDKYEHTRLVELLRQLYPNNDIVSVAVEHNKKGTQGDHFSYSNEFAVFSISNKLKNLNSKLLPENEWEYSNFRNWGSESLRTDAANCFYPIYVQNGKIIGYGDVCDDDYHPQSPNVFIKSGNVEMYVNKNKDKRIFTATEDNPIIAIYPIDDNLIERKWRYAFQSINEIFEYLVIEESRKSNLQIFMPKYSEQFKTMWYSPLYNAGDYGTKVLTSMNFSKDLFQFPKSVYTVKDCIYTVTNNNSIILDYFAGSGTTAHAVIDLNREDKESGNRKYILVEMGNYFNTVTLPRVKKIIYSKDWKDGSPATRNTGISQIVKYIRLESYEDTLNNINLIRNDKQQSIFDSNKNLFEEYLVYYMFDMESKDSLLNLDNFENPFDYRMKITTNNVIINQTIDLVETFNYLIGLYVTSQSRILRFNTRPIPYNEKEPDTYDGAVLLESEEDGEYCFKTVEGKLPNGQSALVIWRNITGDAIKDNAALDAFFNHFHKNKNRKYDVYFVNGDNNLENYRKNDENWKVNLIETVFKKKMFDNKEI